MNSKKNCPECRQMIAKNATHCFCGWKLQDASVTKKRDDRCAYALGERRCPLLGVSSPFSRGSVWYCSGHASVLDDPLKCEMILRDAEENYEKIMEARKDWRIKLLEEMHPGESS